MKSTLTHLIFPVGEGYDWEVNEFDFKKQGEEIYNENGVKIIHWPTIHVSDGQSKIQEEGEGLEINDSRSLSGLTDRNVLKYCRNFLPELTTHQTII